MCLTTKKRIIKPIIGFIIATLGSFASIVNSAEQALNHEAVLAKALQYHNAPWQGPSIGPEAAKNKLVIFISADMRNGGVKGLAAGVAEAAKNLSWDIKFLDGKGSITTQKTAIINAITLRPDGIILGGIEASQQKDLLNAAAKFNIKVLGWHALDSTAIPEDINLFANITTDAQKVAEVAASYAIVDAKKKAKVVIFTDSNYSIAQKKSSTMANVIRRCKTCELLEIINLPLESAAQEMPYAIAKLKEKYSNNITHFLAINDLYFDFSAPFLKGANIHEKDIPKAISAGDGSQQAYQRIRQNKYQIATVPEPLTLQGWQLIDEINRAFNNLPPSNFNAPITIIDINNIKYIDATKNRYDPDNQYRESYLKIWKGEAQ